MKKFLIIIVSFFIANTYSQELNKIPATGVVKHKRVSGFNEIIKDVSNRVNPPVDVVTPTGPSQEVGITEGSLSVSLTGSANYNIPIVVPKGITGVEPKLSLNYNSQGGNGISGYGWEISGLSAITRISSTLFHDGIIDPVDGDDLDRFALDGQRLILKTPTTGTYLINGAVFETENFSNIKVTYLIIGTTGHFVVEYPDGSVAKYGNNTNSQTNTTYAITEWKNAVGIPIKYLYTISNNSIYLSSIEYGSLLNSTAVNSINFEYVNRYRPEESYVNGLLTKIDKILSKIICYSNSIHFREYNLRYEINGLDNQTINYNRLKEIEESTIDNGVIKKYNPTVFNYNSTFDGLTYGNITASLTVGNVETRNSETVSGDFNGDGKMDFILYPTTGTFAKSKYWIFNDNSNVSSQLIDYEHNVGLFQKIIPMSMLNAPINGNYKLSQQQGWCVIKKNGNQTIFTNYFWDPVGIYPEYSVNYNFPTEPSNADSKEFLNGDFNGDGLTDIIVVYKNDGGISPNLAGKSYFVNLDRRIATNQINYSGQIEIYLASKYYVADVNGDGKSDILVFNNGLVSVYSLNSGNYLTLLCQYSSLNLSVMGNDKIILFGDYNGDGKSDFLVSTANNSNVWNKFTSTGNSFLYESQIYQQFNFQLNTGLSSKHYISSDFNHDGKSDIILMSFDVTTINATSGTATMKCFKNINGQFRGGVGFSFSQTTPNTTGFNQFNLPIVYTSDRPNESLEFGFIKGNGIYTFQSYKDFNIDKQLQTITTGNGVKDIISYKPLKPALDASTLSYDNPDIYKVNSLNPQYYPFADIMTAPSLNVVFKLERFGNNYKKQFFTYYGGVQSLNGRGFMGFQETMRTNWFDSDQTNQGMISNVSKFDMSLRGANVLNFSTINYWYLLGQVPSSFISKNITTYNVVNGVYVDPLLPNKVFKLIQNKTENFDGLKNTSSETNMVYNSFNSPTSISTTIKNGTVVEQTNASTIVYDPPLTSPYIIDRLQKKQQSVTAYGDTRTTEEQYTYTALNQVETSKSKSMASDFITTTYEYDTYGNAKKETVSAPDLPVSRITNYQFDPIYNGRFLTKIIDIENLETTYTYDASKGTLLTETNPYNLTTTHTYDAWGKKLSTKDYLNNILTFGYSKTANNTFTITKTMPVLHGGASIEVFDVLGRKIIAGEKNIQGLFSYVKTDYDNLDRTVKTYEPYFLNGADLYSFSPSDFTQSSYDGFSRVSNVTYNTGKTETIAYNGLTSIVTSLADGLSKSKSSTNDAVGNMKSSTELPQGGTINYTYFANNVVKTTSYSGNTITTTLDNWGRKSSLKDPSAGIYNYSYNNIGEILTESTPKGITTYSYDNFGKILTKTVVGKATNNPPTTTNTLTTNVYNSSKLLESTTFNDIENNVVTYYNYEYNSSKQPSKVIEKNGMSRFETQIEYDTFGRPLNQKQNAATLVSGTANINKQSEKWTTNVYQNGVLFKITDGQTTNGSGAVLWQTNETNARGQLTKGQFGNNLFVENLYDTTGRLLNLNHTNSATAGGISSFQMTYNWTNNPQRNLYNSRKFNHINNYNENFTYDNLDRLTSYPNELGVIETQTYAESGKILTNSNGTYNYASSSKPYRNTSIDTNVASKNYYLNNALQQIKYSALKKPISIYQESAVGVAKERIDFLYNVGDSRSTMFYGDTNTNKMSRKFRRHYSSGGTMEITEIRDSSGNIVSTDFITYVGGDAYSAPIILKSDGTTQNYLYLHRDNLGSILAISNQNKVMVEQRVFDAWGNLIKLINSNGQYVLNNGQTLIANYNLFLDRGYTGHEHLLGVGLINMNGRLYDPKLHRFLMPDNNLQDPTNSQNFNRYGYVLNNPLKFIDPSGEEGEENVFELLWAGVAFAATSIALQWDKWEIKDWSNRNLNFNKWSDFGKSVGDFVKNNIQSGIRDVKNFLNNSIKRAFAKSPETTFTAANAYSFAPSGGTSSYVSSVSFSPGGGYNGSAEMHPYVPYRGDIHAPTQHTFLGANMTAMSEGNFFQQMVYSTANSFNVVGQYLMGRGVGDSSMRNLNGTATTTDEGVMAFGTMPLNFIGGSGAKSSLSGIKGQTFAQLKASRGGTETLAKIWTSTGTQRISTEFHHMFITQSMQRNYNLPNWIVNNNLNVWKVNTIQHSLLDSFRYNFLRKGIKPDVGWFGEYNWFTNFK